MLTQQIKATTGLTFPQYVDSSMRADFVSCPKSFYWRYIRHLVLKDTSNVHLHFGSCYAKALEVFRDCFYGLQMSVEDSLANASHSLILAWGEFDAPADSKKTLESAMDALLSYIIQYPPHTDALRPLMVERKGYGHKMPAVEFSFALPIPGSVHPETGEPIIYTGRFDMLGEFGGSGCFVVDDKSTSQLGASWNNRWKLRAQLTGYVWGAEEYGYPIQGVIVRGTSILKSDIGFAQVIEQRPKFQVDRWLGQLQRDVKRMESCWREGYWDYALDDACASYGGCAYVTLDTAKDPQPWIDSYYEQRVWDPLSHGDSA